MEICQYEFQFQNEFMEILERKIQQIYKKLYPYCQPSMDVIQDHISKIQSKTK